MFKVLSDGRRLDILAGEAAGITRSRAAALISSGLCTVDGKECTKPGTKPAAGLEIAITVPEPVDAVPQPEDLPIDIIYEDNDLAVVVKPAGMVVHPSCGNETGTLVNALLFRMNDLSGIGGVVRPGIIHRLDKDTSGLLIIAKNDQSHLRLSQQLAEHRMEKHYLALVEGHVGEDVGATGEIDKPIGRSKTDRKKMAIDPEGRPSQTLWRVLEYGTHSTLLDVRILTGRTHQIRVHMQSIGHPVCGDPIYGRKNGARVPRLMLHSRRITFAHPTSGKVLTFSADIDDEFAAGLQAEGISRR